MRNFLIGLVVCAGIAAPAFSAEPAKFAGDWEGTLDIGVKIRVVMHLVYADGKWTGTTDSPDQGGYGIEFSEVTVDGKDLFWEVKAMNGYYEGTLSKKGDEIIGTLTQHGNPMPLTFVRTGAPSPPQDSKPPVSPSSTTNPFAGDWAGTLDAGMKLRLAMHLVTTNGAWSGTMDSLDQGAKGIPFTSVRVDGAKLHVEIQSINGTYDGTMGENRDTIKGTWSQGGTSLPLDFTRGDAKSIPGPNRPQEPKPPFPYRAEDVTVPGPGGITLAGTLTTPTGNGPFPAVLLISGSGPSDRDESIAGHKPFLVLSDYLTRQGMAVLRLDDRGTGKSTGDFSTATTEDFAQCALAAVAYLKTRKEIDAKKIGLVGHSEGGQIAPIAAARSADVAFVVMMAGVGVRPGNLFVRQISDLTRAGGASDAVIQHVSAAVHRMCQIAMSPAETTLARQQLDAVADSLTAQIGAIDPTKVEMVRAQAHGIAEGMASPWFRYWLTLKPEETLRQVKQPVLALNGSLDLQVAASENLPAIEKALRDGGNKDVAIEELPGLNHLFQTATTGAPMEYGAIEETMSPVAMKKISDWILARTGAKKK